MKLRERIVRLMFNIFEGVDLNNFYKSFLQPFYSLAGIMANFKLFFLITCITAQKNQ